MTDKGPFHGKRVIDLSEAAADKLQLDGVGRVVCYIGKSVGKSIGGTAKETGETVANLPRDLKRVARGIGDTARAPLTRKKGVAIAAKPLSKRAYRKESELYYKARELAALSASEDCAF